LNQGVPCFFAQRGTLIIGLRAQLHENESKWSGPMGWWEPLRRMEKRSVSWEADRALAGQQGAVTG